MNWTSLSLLLLMPFFLSCASNSKSAIEDRGPSSVRLSSAPRCQTLRSLEIHAHRGSNDRPENMISAFERGVDLGADFIELDLQISKDNQVIVAHDAYMRNDCLDAKGLPLAEKVFFRNLTVPEIKKYDCGSQSKIGRPVSGERVPTLADVFKALEKRLTARGLPVGLNIEMKYNPTQPQFYPSRDIYASLVLKTIRESKWASSRIFLQSFDVGVLEALRSQGAEYRLSPLLGEAKDGVSIAQGLRTDTVTPHYGLVNKEMIARYHQAGIRVIPWTVNEAEDAKRMIDLGVDGVITDRLDLFLFANSFCEKN